METPEEKAERLKHTANEAIRDWMEVASANEFFGNVAQIQKEYKMQLAGISTKPKISKELGYTAFGLQIDNGWKPTESIKQAAIEHEEDVDTVLSVKNDKWRHCPTMVNFHSDFFDSKEMSIPTEELKFSVKKSGSLHSGLNRVFKFQQHEKAIRELKDRADAQEELIKQIILNQMSNSVDIAYIKEVSGIELSDKDKAISLRSKGVKYKIIGDILGKSESTIKRWVRGSSSK